MSVPVVDTDRVLIGRIRKCEQLLCGFVQEERARPRFMATGHHRSLSVIYCLTEIRLPKDQIRVDVAIVLWVRGTEEELAQTG